MFRKILADCGRSYVTHIIHIIACQLEKGFSVPLYWKLSSKSEVGTPYIVLFPFQRITIFLIFIHNGIIFFRQYLYPFWMNFAGNKHYLCGQNGYSWYTIWSVINKFKYHIRDILDFINVFWLLKNCHFDGLRDFEKKVLYKRQIDAYNALPFSEGLRGEDTQQLALEDVTRGPRFQCFCAEFTPFVVQFS